MKRSPRTPNARRPPAPKFIGRPEKAGRNAAPPAQLASRSGYCQLYSKDWWVAALATTAMMSITFGWDISVLLYLAAGASIAISTRAQIGRTLVTCWPLLIMPLLCLTSAMWSDAPDITLKQGSELSATFIFAIIIGRRITGVELAAAILVGSFLVCLLNLYDQRQALSVPLVGLMGSKNEMAFLSELLLLSAAAVIAEPKFPIQLRLFGLAGLAVGLVVVVLARSAGAWVTADVVMFTFVVLAVLSRFSGIGRGLIIVAALLCLSPLAFVYKDVENLAQTVQTQYLHKDATLTGRTQIWAVAKTEIAESPVIGHGYNAFWRQGNLDAEGIWQMMGIASRSGFNFHNQFLEEQVDFGAVGFSIFIGVLIYIGAGAIWKSLTTPSVGAAFMVSIVVMLYSRLPVESTLIGTWNLYTLLWVSVGVGAYASSKPLPPASRPARHVVRGGLRTQHLRMGNRGLRKSSPRRSESL